MSSLKKSAVRIGIGGPVGAGKTSFTAAVVKELTQRFSTLREKLPGLSGLPGLPDFQSKFNGLFSSFEDMKFFTHVSQLFESKTETAVAETSTLVQDPTSDTGDAQYVDELDTLMKVPTLRSSDTGDAQYVDVSDAQPLNVSGLNPNSTDDTNINPMVSALNKLLNKPKDS